MCREHPSHSAWLTWWLLLQNIWTSVRVWLTVHSAMGGIYWERQLLKIMCPPALQSLHNSGCWWWVVLKMLPDRPFLTDLSSLSWWLLSHLTTQELEQGCLILKSTNCYSLRKMKVFVFGAATTYILSGSCVEWELCYRLGQGLQTHLTK